MKPLATPQEILQSDSSEPDDDEPTPTGASQPPAVTQAPLPVRPTFARSPLGTLSNTEHNAANEWRQEEPTTGSNLNINDGAGSDYGSSRPTQATVSGSVSASASSSKGMVQIAPHENLAELKDALSAKMLAQSRARRGYGSGSSMRTETKRVSPIKEEDAASSTSSFNSVLGGADDPVRTTSTVSTDSTESNRTVKGSVPPTPLNAPLRTPSYPFPYVPGTPRWSYSASASGHQPFTALSPTTPTQPRGDHETSGRGSVDMHSVVSTPAANSAFGPPGLDFQGLEDPQYPTPNLYDLVLQLNSEPGLEQWWATVTNILHDHFKAERATLVQPIDPTDIENVPWGQKATFSMSGREEFVSQRTLREQTSLASQHGGSQRPEFVLREPSAESSNDGPQKLHLERLRPRLESRHSYAGHGREVKDILGTLNDPATQSSLRPQGPLRTATHAAGITTGTGFDKLPPKHFQSGPTARNSSIGDPDFSSIAGGVDAGPYAEVFETPRNLDFESRPLLGSGGVCSVLDRGRLVAVTRDYVSDPQNSRGADSGTDSIPKSGPVFGDYRPVFMSDKAPELRRDYEEYEQHPTSPWAQSPAPSPAIQSDEENNPFFTSDDQHVNESFDPAISPTDYSQFGQVEAIGVDNASTVLHVPLIHPTLSQPMQSLRATPSHSERAEKLQRNNTLDMNRKAPIGILSLLTPTVPYPHNLMHTIKLLGPHLATSFATAQQFSTAHAQPVTIRHRRTVSGRQFTHAPMTVEPASLDDIANLELEQIPGSLTGSMTSPSDYSGRSRTSPSGSIVGTPGWDPAAHGWTGSRSVAGTPAVTGSEMVDSYFVAKKRSGNRTGNNANAASTPAKITQKPSGAETVGNTIAEDETAALRTERNVTAKMSTNEEKLPTGAPPRDLNSYRPTEMPTSSQPRSPSISSSPEFPKDTKQHSLLHSYGADFQSTFGIASSMTTSSEARPPAVSVHSRKPSYPEDMPPPSERLLRTIIDSVPVQIFTAQPETGQLSWVNSKFLIYRGLEPRQVLSDPWSAIHAQDRDEFLSAWHRSLRSNQQLQQKVRLQRFDGSYRWFYVRAAPLKDKRQHVVHWIGTMMDFHEQQLAEMNSARQTETAASEAKYRALANSSPQIVFAVNRSSGVTFCNTQWLHYSGQTESQALGAGFIDHVHPEDLAKCRLPTFDEGSDQPTNVPISIPPEPRRAFSQSNTSDISSETEKPASAESTPDDRSVSPVTHKPVQRQLSELASTGILKVTRDADGRPSYSTEVRLRSKDGNFRWHLVRVLLADSRLHNEEETWYGTCTDINDHKTLERDLKETMDEKSRFLSNMSHEIRTPLNGITGMVNFLIDSSLTVEQMEHVNIIRASTEGLRGLINDILDLSKAEAGMIQLSMDWLYVRALIEEVNDLTSTMAIDKGLELNYVVEKDVPPQIKGDRFRIRQILLNIVGNAIKFTARGEVFVRCCLQEGFGELAKNETYIRFEIVDSGRGFTDKEAEFLFKRFSQIDGSSTRQHGGTGLGLVISKQLAELHGGDISAEGVPGKGSTFTFFIKTTIPSRLDQPPASTTSVQSLPIKATSSLPAAALANASFTKFPPVTSAERQGRAAPRFLHEVSQSPSPYGSPDAGRDSPSVSSASSDPSVHSVARSSSLRSERSSASSILPDVAVLGPPPMKLSLPPDASTASSSSSPVGMLATPPATVGALKVPPPMFSILVVAPLKYSREATVRHIDETLPKNVPHQITARESFSECQRMLDPKSPILFTHVVAVLQDVEEIIALMNQVLWSAISTTALVLITDLAQRRNIVENAPDYNYDQLVADRKLQFVFKPLKPSRFGLIFDPQKEREMSLDRNQDSAQQVAHNQKQVFDELAKRLGNKDKRVLLVEDNRVNQMVVLKFLAKVSIKADTVLDGVQCTDKVFANPPGYYSIILCDLHMPNKDGYQTCKEIRKWEKKNKFSHLPIIALSANVLGDVYQKCVEAGFNSYMTKPVDFKELSTVLMTFMDPSDPNKPHELMQMKRAHVPENLISLR